ncbi:MAG: hypothetical protein AAB354_03455 [candidate division KSB1 bacterium]
MGWRGALRSLAAASRAAERESTRRQRDFQERRNYLVKMEKRALASDELELYENRIEVLTSIHKDCSNTWDWEKIRAIPLPAKPSSLRKHEKLATQDYENFKPSFFDKLLGRVESKRNKLLNEVKAAKQRDELDYEEVSKVYKEKYSKWRETCELAAQILDGKTDAYIEAIKQINPFSEIKGMVSAISFDVINHSLIDFTIKVNDETMIPSEVKSLLKSGKLSKKQMPKTQFYQLYQDCVCSCIFRVARELFALLPIRVAIVTAAEKLLNPATGFVEEQPILSAIIPKRTLDELNFDMIDPSSALSNFIHRMDFKRIQGFNAIVKLPASDVSTA